ncbi:MAG TPA: NAD+ synthase [Thermomicrobiales bacterium]|nr:NAD+ synthase [Thermomicrobiales bacterium]
MDGPLRVALAQVNMTVGDLDGNAARIVATIDEARERGAQVVIFPELAVTGYPPEDLLLKPAFVADNIARLREIAGHTRGIVAVVGFVDAAADIYNAAAVLVDGEWAGAYHKRYLPNYGVFDEDRYFMAGDSAPVFCFGDEPVGINVCEDIWYPVGPATLQSLAGARLILNINASPYSRSKQATRETMLATRAMDNDAFVCYVNLVGGQDELVFDGGSVIFDPAGRVVARAPQFAEHLLLADLDLASVFRSRLHDPLRRKEKLLDELSAAEVPRVALPPFAAPAARPPLAPDVTPLLPDVAEVYRALVLGTGDYVRKNGFKEVVLGLSGGIDSALVATIAADALGPDAVTGVSMPSRYSSAGSKDDARDLAERLGILYRVIPIEGTFQAALAMLGEAFAGTKPNIAEENLQARIRGNTLMALSNKFGSLVLTTGNKSEMAVGYATIYGDMAGGFAVLKDVPKTLVYALARWRNAHGGEVIPVATIEKPPSAELRPDQQDTDTLPPYDVLDPILQAYVEEDRSAAEIVAAGADPALVRRVIRMVDINEYKRRQAPPGVKITGRAFGRDRRLPITNGYRDGGGRR